MPMPFESFRLLNGAPGHKVKGAKYARGDNANMAPPVVDDVNGPYREEQVVVDSAVPADALASGAVRVHVPAVIGYFVSDIRSMCITELVVENNAGNRTYTFPAWELFYEDPNPDPPDANLIRSVDLQIGELDLTGNNFGIYARAEVVFGDFTSEVYYSPVILRD